MRISIAVLSIVTIVAAVYAQNGGTGSEIFKTSDQCHGVPQRAADAGRGRRLDRRELARVDDGQLVARSVLAGRRATGSDRSSARRRTRFRMNARRATCRCRAPSRGSLVRRAQFSIICRSTREGDGAIGWRTMAWRVRCAIRSPTGISARLRVLPADSSSRRRRRRSRGRCSARFRSSAGLSTIMRSATGFQPTEAPHVRQSELCATCHTLVTKARGSKGEIIGELPEQMPFLEWKNSAFRERAAELSVLPHARRRAGDADCIGPRRSAERVSHATRLSAATSSCSEC